VVYDQASRTGRFHYAQQPPPGRYVATLVGAGINDDAGNTLSPDRVITFAVTAAVIRRLAFYNGSKYDGNDSAANALDDAAIPPNKAALLPGQTGSFANLISDPAGITGVMIDVDHVPPGVTLTPDDFVTRVGLAGVDPSAWAAGPAPSLVAVRRGAGTGGSDRVTLIWPDNSIRNTWLQVTMKADERTGLARPDVFYLASLVGERGSVSDLLDTYRVDATDLAGVKAALNTDASIINTVDFNRDGRVNALDLGAAKSNLNRSLERLRAPLASAAPSGAAPSFVAPALGEPGAAVGRVWDEQLPGLLG